MFGYVPLGMAFGILFSTLDYAWYYATLMGVVVFAGAAQYLAVGLLAAGAGLLEVFVATLLLNSRHIFYGLTMLPRYPRRGLARWYLIFGLTDETYALLSGLETRSPRFYLLVTGLNQIWWVIGCTLGALLAEAVSFNSQGMEFALVALFLVLLYEQMKAIGEWLAPMTGVAGVSIALWLVPSQHVLLLAILLAVIALWMEQGWKTRKAT
jgi:4-azaleucine resistance transporter AzlC